MMVDTLLCLACSSSLPPKSSSPIFTTPCCTRPICPPCITANPRLARYNPCLACLGGVAAVGSSSFRNARAPTAVQPVREPAPRNLDGAVRDEDTFVLGDDEEDEDEAPSYSALDSAQQSAAENTPPEYYPLASAPSSSGLEVVETQATLVDGTEMPAESAPSPQEYPPVARPKSHSSPGPASSSRLEAIAAVGAAAAEPPAEPSPPAKYYLKRDDTIRGIALRLKLDGRELCRLNNLPPSTMTTTPHLLHTRGFLTLPPTAQSKLQASDAWPSTDEERAREARRVRERAEKRLQTLTKEVDWRVAKAYIALADDSDEEDTFARKQKELGASSGAGSSRLEAAAVERYLDDLEWEANQLRVGRSVHIPPLPRPGQLGIKS